MDSEERHKIEAAAREGRPQTDEGPDYHTAWWESYKGIGKGYLGGAAIGGTVGTLVGAAVAVTLAATVGIATTALTPLMAGVAITAGFATTGMIYGAHQFSDIGKIVGSGAAIAENQDKREKARFAALEKKIDDLKSLITCNKPLETSTATPEEQHRTTHCDGHCDPKQPWVFKKVAAIGLIAGLAAGALLAASGMAGHVIHGLGVGETFAASMATMGMFGASFGINRDAFRQVFDKTDLLYKGLTEKSRSPEAAIAVAPSPPPVPSVNPTFNKTSPTASFITVVCAENTDQTHTFHRDKLAASTKLALLNMDHSKAISH